MEKPILLNPFNQNQRKLFQVGIVLLLVILIAILYLISQHISGKSTNSKVILSDSNLQVFDDTYESFNYPDKISIHYPYFLVIQPEKTRTIIYNLETKQKQEEFKNILIDFDGKNILANGKETIFNQTGLGILCSSAFIQSEKEVLCATNNSINEVVSIDPRTKKQEVIYRTNNLITSVSVIQGKMYIGKMDTPTNKSYLVVDGKKIEVPSPVNLVYPMDNNLYIGSIKSVFTKNRLIYYLLKGKQMEMESKEKIVVLK